MFAPKLKRTHGYKRPNNGFAWEKSQCMNHRDEFDASSYELKRENCAVATNDEKTCQNFALQSGHQKWWMEEWSLQESKRQAQGRKRRIDERRLASSSSSTSEPSSSAENDPKGKNKQANAKKDNPNKKEQADKETKFWDDYNAESEIIQEEMELKHGAACQSWAPETALAVRKMAEELQRKVNMCGTRTYETEAVKSLVRLLPELVYKLREFPGIPEETKMSISDAADCIYLVILLADQTEEFWNQQDNVDKDKINNSRRTPRYQLKILPGTARLCR